MKHRFTAPPPVIKRAWAREPHNLTCTGGHKRKIPAGAWLFWVDSTLGSALCETCATVAGHGDPPSTPTRIVPERQKP